MKKGLTRMGTADYANARGISVQAVCKAAKLQKPLPAVEYYEMIGGSYVFYVNEEHLKKLGSNKKKLNLRALNI